MDNDNAIYVSWSTMEECKLNNENSIPQFTAKVTSIKEVKKAMYRVESTMQYYMEQAITHTKEFYFSTHHMPWYINQLLRGQAVNHEVLNYNARKIGFITDKQFFLWTFQKSNIDEK